MGKASRVKREKKTVEKEIALTEELSLMVGPAAREFAIASQRVEQADRALVLTMRSLEAAVLRCSREMNIDMKLYQFDPATMKFIPRQSATPEPGAAA